MKDDRIENLEIAVLAIAKVLEERGILTGLYDEFLAAQEKIREAEKET